ncbi:MAG: NDP-sugar synthase [Candidatus Binatia bacterium]
MRRAFARWSSTSTTTAPPSAPALGDGAAYEVSIRYSEEDPLLDTGGGILRARPLLGDERFVVLNSDSIIDLDLRRLVDWHVAHASVATMVPRRDREQARRRDRDRRRASRPPLPRPPAAGSEPLTPYMFAGVHVLEPAVFDHMGTGTFRVVRQTYPALLAAGRAVRGYVYDGYWRVLDTHAGLAEGRYEAHRQRQSARAAESTLTACVIAHYLAIAWVRDRWGSPSSKKRPQGSQEEPEGCTGARGGAITGGAFKLGGLKALDDLLVNRKTTEFDSYIGLSAGAVLAAP